MCGIVYAFRKDGKPVQKRVLKRYSKQRERGSDGFGYVALASDNSVMQYKRTQTEEEIRHHLKKSTSAHVLFHHRFPTSTTNLPEAAHPILVKHAELKYSYYVVHNGVISNPDSLRKEHLKLGYKYTTEIQSQYQTKKGKVYYGELEYNDSEALAIELARTIEGKQEQVGARGSIATIVLQMSKDAKKAYKVFYGTNGGNPLTVNHDEHGFVIASQGGTPIPANTMFMEDLETDELVHVSVPFIPYTVASYPAKPYGWHYAGYGYVKDVDDYPPPSYKVVDEDDDIEESALNAIGFRVADSVEEKDMEALYDELEDIKVSIAIAKEAGESEELLGLEYDQQRVQESIMMRMETHADEISRG